MGIEFEDINGNVVRAGWMVEIMRGASAGMTGAVTGMRGNCALVSVDGREIEVAPDELLLKERKRPAGTLTQEL